MVYISLAINEQFLQISTTDVTCNVLSDNCIIPFIGDERPRSRQIVFINSKTWPPLLACVGTSVFFGKIFDTVEFGTSENPRYFTLQVYDLNGLNFTTSQHL